MCPTTAPRWPRCAASSPEAAWRWSSRRTAQTSRRSRIPRSPLRSTAWWPSASTTTCASTARIWSIASPRPASRWRTGPPRTCSTAMWSSAWSSTPPSTSSSAGSLPARPAPSLLLLVLSTHKDLGRKPSARGPALSSIRSHALDDREDDRDQGHPTHDAESDDQVLLADVHAVPVHDSVLLRLARFVLSSSRQILRTVKVTRDFQGSLSRVQGAGEPPIGAVPTIRRLQIQRALA